MTVETCPHYLCLEAEGIPDGATHYKCAPPIRGAENRERLWHAEPGPDDVEGQAVVAKATSMGKLMGLVNCAGIAPAEKTVGKNGPHNLALYQKVVQVNLVGTFNMIRLAATAMERNAQMLSRELTRRTSFDKTTTRGRHL